MRAGVARLVLCARHELAASRSHNQVINRRVISVNQLFSVVNTLVYLIRICISMVHSVVRASKQEALRPDKQLANYGRTFIITHRIDALNSNYEDGFFSKGGTKNRYIGNAQKRDQSLV